MAGSGIPAKGAGNGSPRKNFTSETAKVAGEKGNFVQSKMREWRAANPDAPLTMMERDKLIREALRESAPERVDTMIQVALDPEHKDFAPTSRVLMEHDLGKPKQAIELGNGDGGPLRIVVTQDDTGLL